MADSVFYSTSITVTEACTHFSMNACTNAKRCSVTLFKKEAVKDFFLVSHMGGNNSEHSQLTNYRGHKSDNDSCTFKFYGPCLAPLRPLRAALPLLNDQDFVARCA